MDNNRVKPGPLPVPESARQESIFLMQTITVMLRSAVINYVNSLRRLSPMIDAKPSMHAVRRALGFYFSVKQRGDNEEEHNDMTSQKPKENFHENKTDEKTSHGEGTPARTWSDLERGVRPDVSNDRVREYFSLSFLGERGPLIRVPMLKSAGLLEIKTIKFFEEQTDADENRNYFTEEIIIKQFIQQYGIGRINEVAKRMTLDRHAFTHLNDSNFTFINDVNDLIRYLSFELSYRLLTGQPTKFSLREIERLIENDPILRRAYSAIQKRIQESIGPELDKAFNLVKVKRR